MSAPSALSSFERAVTHHQRGELDQAITLYQALLAQKPDHADALHLLGVAFLQRGQAPKAIELIERAVALYPTQSAFHGNLAEAYRVTGQVQKANASFQLSLRLQPAAPDVANNYGSLLMQQKRTTEAAQMFQLAIQHRPDFAVAHNNLGNAFRVLGDINKAITHFRKAVELNPQLGYAHGNLGQILLDCGKPQEALPHCQHALRLQPQAAAAHNNLGNVYRKLGNYNESRSHYLAALRLAPNLAIVQNNLGQTLYEEGKFDEALTWFRQAAQLDPASVRFQLNLVGCLMEQHTYDEAEPILRAILGREPDNIEGRYYLAKLHFEQGRLEDAVAGYRTILHKHPNHPFVNHCLGETLLELNQPEQAVTCFRAALKSNPRFVASLAHLATHLRDKLPAEEMQTMQGLLADSQLSDAERAPLLFGMAQVRDAEGKFDEAAEHLEKANALEFSVRRQRSQLYNAEAHEKFVDRLLKVFNPEFFERVQGFGVDSERPVFIIGLPRSGTTLLEQVLASHSRVHGAGEQRISRENFEYLGGGADGASESSAFDKLERIDRARVHELAGRHLQRLDKLNADADRVIDKMPDNYMYLGFLSMLFPKARFLHCRRDLRDIAVSCWITEFRAIRWANSRDDILSRFTQYSRIVEHWQRVLPAPVLEVEYEDMVNDLESVARRVVDFCGLDWEPACLEFHRSARPVRTASVTQVRQPIYRRSLERWRKYERTLRPLFDRLERLMTPRESKQPVGV
jgi:tetratricopeptide (TPR) repeat protein